MGGKEGRRGVLERGRGEFGDEFVMIFSCLTLIYVVTKAVFFCFESYTANVLKEKCNILGNVSLHPSHRKVNYETVRYEFEF